MDKKLRPPELSGKCEDCVFYDYDDACEAFICTLNLDEDEMLDFLGHHTGDCPYFRRYDEYGTVRKQN